MSRGKIADLGRLTDALISFYGSDDQKRALLEQIEKLMDYLSKEPEISLFLKDYGLRRESKKGVIEELERALGLDELISNTLSLMVDTLLISKFELFLSTLRSHLLRKLNIKNVYVYSSFPIRDEQRIRLERAWNNRLNAQCNFFYGLDKSLRLGIKVQVDLYIEEYSLSSSLNRLKIKLDSLLNY